MFNALTAWLSQGQNAAAAQALSAIATVLLTVVLVIITTRYTRLTAKSVRLTEQHFLLSVFPKLRLDVQPHSVDRHSVVCSVKNVGNDDVVIKRVAVCWE